MQYTRPMIELVYELRRRVHADLKPSIKLSNPELFDELTTHFHATKCPITRALTKELFSLAGDPWTTLLEKNEKHASKQVAKVYRGQASLEDAPDRSDSGQTRQKPVKIYRGQVVR
ncbi:hypothetical protein [Exilibacterium tricleocarpae]|uniref:hypothetical protein n=1 Tax=Exilibacterium tricleocarpae TaxID=2591008 RepID=UPI0015D3ABE7|nr:hypothetical protein [Exilibacterium tricleocarpae]